MCLHEQSAHTAKLQCLILEGKEQLITFALPFSPMATEHNISAIAIARQSTSKRLPGQHWYGPRWPHKHLPFVAAP